MKCTYKFMIYDVTKEKMFDYCQSSFNKVLDWAEAEKLCSEDYQEKIAWAICVGILQYLNMK